MVEWTKMSECKLRGRKCINCRKRSQDGCRKGKFVVNIAIMHNCRKAVIHCLYESVLVCVFEKHIHMKINIRLYFVLLSIYFTRYSTLNLFGLYQ